MNKLVSIIIPTYKGALSLSRAIDSVLNQTYSNLEIIIVDDNNTDTEERKKTELLIGQYSDSRINYIKHKQNSNGAVARNTGIKSSKGNYITFLDDDDFMLPNRIEIMLKYILENKECESIYSSVILTSKDKIIGHVKADKILETKDILLDEMVMGTGSNIFISREILDKVRGFDENFLRHQDLEFMIRVCKYTKILNINEFLVVKSTNGTNNTANYRKLKETKKMFVEKFKSEINNMSSEEINNFYMNNSANLYLSAVLTNNVEYINEAQQDLKKYRLLSFKENVYYIIVRAKILNVSMSIYRKLRKIIKNDNELNLTQEQITFINSKICSKYRGGN